MSSSSGYTFIDDSQMSVCEKINKYFSKQSRPLNVAVVNEESDESNESIDSFSCLDESFADLLNSNSHVTLLRKSKKEKDSMLHSSTNESHIDLAGPNATQSPRKSYVRDDSFEYTTDNWWDKVSDESFLEVERQCNAAYGDEQKLLSLAGNDNTLLFDVEEPSFLNNTSVYATPSMLSPMKQVAMRRPSTIIEESTVHSINSSDNTSNNTSSEESPVANDGDSASLIKFEDVLPVVSKPNVSSYRPSICNVFPIRKKNAFYADVAMPTENACKTSQPEKEDNQENSIYLMTFDDTLPEEEAAASTLDKSVCSDNNETRDQFNDTLEAVDYYMEQGQKLMDKTTSAAAVKTPIAIFSPKHFNNSLLKQTLANRHFRSISGDSLNMSFFK